jgi:hypothetical protein
MVSVENKEAKKQNVFSLHSNGLCILSTSAKITFDEASLSTVARGCGYACCLLHATNRKPARADHKHSTHTHVAPPRIDRCAAYTDPRENNFDRPDLADRYL